MRLRTLLAVLTFGLCFVFLCCQLTPAAKRIELWKPTPPKPDPGTVETTQEASDETQEEPPEETRPAKILREAALKHGLELVGEVVSLSADSLAPTSVEEPAAEEPTIGAASPDEATEGEQSEGDEPEGPGSPLSSLPSYLTREPFDDYALVALGAGEFKHPQGQTLHAALFEFDTAQDAWGLWSVGRGDKRIIAGQAASWGGTLRVWKGPFAAVLSMEEPNERLAEVLLTKFAHLLFADVPGRGSPPEMVGWLPLTNQLAHTTGYFHANALAAGESLQLTPETEGVSAFYEVGETGYRAVIVRYPDREAALEAWKAFVSQELGLDPASGDPGGRRRAPRGGVWHGVRTKGRVGAFVLGAPSRNLTEVMLAQTCARAHD